MKSFCLAMIAALTVAALFCLYVAPDINRMQADIQAYQTRSLLPELPTNTNQGLGE